MDKRTLPGVAPEVVEVMVMLPDCLESINACKQPLSSEI